MDFKTSLNKSELPASFSLFVAYFSSYTYMVAFSIALLHFVHAIHPFYLIVHIYSIYILKKILSLSLSSAPQAQGTTDEKQRTHTHSENTFTHANPDSPGTAFQATHSVILKSKIGERPPC